MLLIDLYRLRIFSAPLQFRCSKAADGKPPSLLTKKKKTQPTAKTSTISMKIVWVRMLPLKVPFLDSINGFICIESRDFLDCYLSSFINISTTRFFARKGWT